MESLSDIEALSLQCRTSQSREYISEAIACYRASAYRAAIVATWIAVVFDLVDKIRELSLAGDGSAKKLEKDYKTYQEQIEHGNEQGKKNALEFERNILQPCMKQLQLFDHQQFLDLSRLREDRHRCAHPSFQKIGEPYRPSAEQARLHLRNAIVHVLSRPPVQGRFAVAELSRLVESAYFPTDVALAVTQLKNSPLGRATDALVRGFVDLLLGGFCEPTSPLHNKPQVLSAVSATIELYRSPAESRISTELVRLIRTLADSELVSAVAIVGSVEPAWSLLDQPSKDKISAFVRSASARDVSKVLAPLFRITDLSASVSARIETLELKDLATGIDVYGFGPLAKKRAIDLLSRVRQWVDANEVINKAILPIFEYLDRADIERIIRLPTESHADLPGSNSYTKFIERVRLANLIPRDDLNDLLRANRASALLPTDAHQEQERTVDEDH